MEAAVSSETGQICCALSVMDSPGGPEFKRRIVEICGEDVLQCYQCGECTAGCPAAFAMDVAPNQVLRMAQLGMRMMAPPAQHRAATTSSAALVGRDQAASAPVNTGIRNINKANWPKYTLLRPSL